MDSVVSLETLNQYFQNYIEHSDDNRRNAERDRDFYDGKQWTAEEAAIIKGRHQVPVVINKLAGKIDWMLGMERQQRTDPKAFPRTPRRS